VLQLDEARRYGPIAKPAALHFGSVRFGEKAYRNLEVASATDRAFTIVGWKTDPEFGCETVIQGALSRHSIRMYFAPTSSGLRRARCVFLTDDAEFAEIGVDLDGYADEGLQSFGSQ
jgi:hypothetical protein